MSQHYTKLTLGDSKWCKKCVAFTEHKVEGGRITRICVPCDVKAEAERQRRLLHPAPAAPVQTGLFAEEPDSVGAFAL
jgi:hypothetical protein